MLVVNLCAVVFVLRFLFKSAAFVNHEVAVFASWVSHADHSLLLPHELRLQLFLLYVF